MKAKTRVHNYDTTSNEDQSKAYTTKFMILPNQENAYGECWVYLEVCALNKFYEKGLIKSQKRIRKRLNSGVLVRPNKWNKKTEQTKSVEDNNKLLKFRLSIENRIQAIKDGQEFTDVDNDLKTLHSIFAEGKKKEKINQKSIISYIEDYIEHRKGTGTPYGTLKQYISLKNRLIVYQNDTDEIITLDSINLSLSDKLIRHFSDKKYHPNTIKKTIDFLKTMLNYYYERKEELEIELSDKFRSKLFGAVNEIKTDPIALNETEIDVLQKFNFEQAKEKELIELKSLIKKGKIEVSKTEFYKANIENKFKGIERTRKQALLQLSTGLRVSDLFSIKPSTVNGELITLRPKKTLNTKEDNTIYIPLNKISKSILEEVNYDSSHLKISSQKYNENLKQLFMIIGLDEEVEIFEYKGINNPKATYVKKYEVLTSHNLRDTFISIAIKKNVPIPILLKATGQSSYEVMKRYIKLENQDMINHLGKMF